MSSQQAVPRQTAGWAIVVLIISVSLWSLTELRAYAALFTSLHGKTVAERGQLASNPQRDFLGRAGRTNLRRRLAAQPEAVNASLAGVGDGWRWCYEGAEHVPANARIHLNAPRVLVYYYGSFFWYPARLRVSRASVLVRDAETLEHNLEHVPASGYRALQQLGYTHVINQQATGATLISLDRAVGGEVKPDESDEHDEHDEAGELGGPSETGEHGGP